MPKLKFRFRVTFENFGVSQPTTELTKQVIDFTRPKLSFEEMIIPIYNSKVILLVNLRGKLYNAHYVMTQEMKSLNVLVNNYRNNLTLWNNPQQVQALTINSLHAFKYLMVAMVLMKHQFLKLGNYMVAIYQIPTMLMLTMLQMKQ